MALQQKLCKTNHLIEKIKDYTLTLVLKILESHFKHQLG